MRCDRRGAGWFLPPWSAMLRASSLARRSHWRWRTETHLVAPNAAPPATWSLKTGCRGFSSPTTSMCSTHTTCVNPRVRARSMHAMPRHTCTMHALGLGGGGAYPGVAIGGVLDDAAGGPAAAPDQRAGLLLLLQKLLLEAVRWEVDDGPGALVGVVHAVSEEDHLPRRHQRRQELHLRLHLHAHVHQQTNQLRNRWMDGCI